MSQTVVWFEFLPKLLIHVYGKISGNPHFTCISSKNTLITTTHKHGFYKRRKHICTYEHLKINQQKHQLYCLHRIGDTRGCWLLRFHRSCLGNQLTFKNKYAVKIITQNFLIRSFIIDELKTGRPWTIKHNTCRPTRWGIFRFTSRSPPFRLVLSLTVTFVTKGFEKRRHRFNFTAPCEEGVYKRNYILVRLQIFLSR